VIAEVASPCVKVCEMDDAIGLCRGCLRTLDEIACWSGLPPEGRRAVIAATEARRARLFPAATAGANEPGVGRGGG